MFITSFKMSHLISIYVVKIYYDYVHNLPAEGTECYTGRVKQLSSRKAQIKGLKDRLWSLESLDPDKDPTRTL